MLYFIVVGIRFDRCRRRILFLPMQAQKQQHNNEMRLHFMGIPCFFSPSLGEPRKLGFHPAAFRMGSVHSCHRADLYFHNGTWVL